MEKLVACIYSTSSATSKVWATPLRKVALLFRQIEFLVLLCCAIQAKWTYVVVLLYDFRWSESSWEYFIRKYFIFIMMLDKKKTSRTNAICTFVLYLNQLKFSSLEFARTKAHYWLYGYLVNKFIFVKFRILNLINTSNHSKTHCVRDIGENPNVFANCRK